MLMNEKERLVFFELARTMTDEKVGKILNVSTKTVIYLRNKYGIKKKPGQIPTQWTKEMDEYITTSKDKLETMELELNLDRETIKKRRQFLKKRAEVRELMLKNMI